MPQTLEEYHTKIERMMAEGDALVAARDPASEDAVKRRMAESALVIASYQLFVHRQVFAPMLEHADVAMRARVNELKVECIALTEDLRFNVREFVARVDDGPLDWDQAAAGVAWFNGRVRAHIAHVRQMMAPELSDAEHARLRARRTATIGVQAA
ncbi:hypothetical protein [Sphingomonas pruni]|uniref:hypothetical protein n=1 Tax=Sphingomonas pruni TaxID=40683 RepID=UPI000836BC0F|nr:hypothetical protein [Sphingomonas pruni]